MTSIILTLRPETFVEARVPLATSWLLSDCMELRGKQDLWTRQKPEALEALRQQAIIQSVESSNRIEGVTVAPERLRPIAIGNARPKDRPEEELAGYRRTLEWIFQSRTGRESPPLTPKTILHLHALCQVGAADAGKIKSRDNEIIEIKPSGQRIVRFRPTPAKLTPDAIRLLCKNYENLRHHNAAPSLLVIATTVFDFLCIHPFRDGNGRVARLLTTLLLQQHSFIVGKFISLERIIESSKEDYYHSLHICSEGWDRGKNKILPWWNYFLTVLRRAYSEFSEKVEHSQSRRGKSELIQQLALSQVGPFTVADLQQQLPNVSVPLIKKILGGLRKEKLLALTGRGPGARWTLRSPPT